MDDHPQPLTIAVAALAYPGEAVSGDGWSIHWRDNSCRIALIDGLGHGPGAAVASERARTTLDDNPELLPGESIHRCHDALAGTRGAAMAVAAIRYEDVSLTYSAVGNVEAQLWNGQRVKRPITYRGIVGRRLPTSREEVVPLETSDWLLVLYSDGIRQRFDLESLPEFIARDAQALADRILHDWSRDTDDATVIVAMPRRPPPRGHPAAKDDRGGVASSPNRSYASQPMAGATDHGGARWRRRSATSR